MKKLFIFCLAGLMLLVLPGLAVAVPSFTSITPTNGQIFNNGAQQIDLSWNLLSPGGACDYSSDSFVEIGKTIDTDGQFFYDRDLVDYQSLSNSIRNYKTILLNPGVYYWHVSSVFNIDCMGLYARLWSPIWSFTIQSPPPPAPQPVTNPQPQQPTVQPQPQQPAYTSPIKPKKKVKVATGLHKKKCKNKKYHASHCKTVSKNKKQSAKNKKFHAKKCSKTVLK